MSEWWSYTLSDFLLFSPRAYYRLFELYNQSQWPVQLLFLALGAAIPVLLYRGGPHRGRIIAAILAAGWLWVAWAFHLQRYATIHWAAVYFAAGFAVEAALLVWAGVIRGELALPPSRTGLGLFLFGLILYPVIGPVLGRPWPQTEVFGVGPDPTIIATLGILLPAASRPPLTLLLVPMLWCAVSGATLWAMRSPEALVLPLAALLVLFRLRNRL
jgi:hypothetical protein